MNYPMLLSMSYIPVLFLYFPKSFLSASLLPFLECLLEGRDYYQQLYMDIQKDAMISTAFFVDGETEELSS